MDVMPDKIAEIHSKSLKMRHLRFDKSAKT